MRLPSIAAFGRARSRKLAERFADSRGPRADSTRRGYAPAWRQHDAWCKVLAAAPPLPSP